jgi:nucleotide-binding universal stress UspA family protein
VNASVTAIVGVDGTDRSRDALSLGAALSPSGSRLLIAHVHPYGQLEDLLGDGKYETLVRETTESIFDDVRDIVPDTVERKMRLVSDRSPARGLEQLANDEGADVVIVGSSERSGVQRVLMGSVAESLLSGAPVPVALAPRGYADRKKVSWDVIGCAFNGSAEARAALDLAKDLSVRLDAGLRLLGVHQPVPGVSSGTFQFESVNQSLREDLRRELEEAAAANKTAQAATTLLEGDPASALVRQSEELDLLVVGSRGYGPVRSVVLGSVSRTLAREAACPVIVAPRPG